MNYSRRPIPGGAAGLIVIAAALAPVVVSAFRPALKRVAKGISRFGEKLDEALDKKGTEGEPEQPNATVKEETSKVNKEAAGVDLETVTPMGQEEVEQQVIAEQKGTAKATPRRQTKESNQAKTPTPEQPLNAKRTGVTTKAATPRKKKPQ